MKRIDSDFEKYIGQGENPDLLASVVEFDRRFDQFFKVDYEKSEKGITRTEQYIYPGLKDSALLTSYLDYFQIYGDVPIGATIVDLGAGYCRGSMLFNNLKDKRCISVECEESRVEAALSSSPEDIIVADLLDKKFELPLSEYYFIYLPVGVVLYEIIKKVIDQKIEATFYIIESHGDLVNYLLMQSEIFTLVDKPFKTSVVRHDPFIYKFRSKRVTIQPDSLSFENDMALWHLFNHDKNLKLEIESSIPGRTSKSKWFGVLLGSTLIKYNGQMALYLENPSRVLQLGTQDKILSITR
jgi:hypothetical protein